MNSFQLDFFTRLREWSDLRISLAGTSVLDKCIGTDNFWQKCPMSKHYLHPADISSWPDPWQLLDDNLYCPYARALGMIYTLLMLGISDIAMINATDGRGDDVVLVIVNNEIVLNYWPNTLLNNKLQDFTVVKTYDLHHIIKRINNI